MQVVCTREPVAYVDPGLEGNVHAQLNLIPAVLIERFEHDGQGGTHLVDGGCGHAFEFEAADDASYWDVNTEADADGTMYVIERHVEPRCPSCGASAQRFSMPVSPRQELASYLRGVRDEHLARRFPDDRVGDMSDDLRDMLWRGVRGGADAGYTNVTGGAVALSAATAKTIEGWKSHANFGLSRTGLMVGFDGVTASAVPVLVEWGYCTWATNGPGTNSTSTTPAQEYGRVITVGATAGKTWTTEPTTITVLDEELLTPNGGWVKYDWPLGKEPDCAVSEGFVIRCNAPATVNVRATDKARRA